MDIKLDRWARGRNAVLGVQTYGTPKSSNFLLTANQSIKKQLKHENRVLDQQHCEKQLLQPTHMGWTTRPNLGVTISLQGGKPCTEQNRDAPMRQWLSTVWKHSPSWVGMIMSRAPMSKCVGLLPRMGTETRVDFQGYAWTVDKDRGYCMFHHHCGQMVSEDARWITRSVVTGGLKPLDLFNIWNARGKEGDRFWTFSSLTALNYATWPLIRKEPYIEQ